MNLAQSDGRNKKTLSMWLVAQDLGKDNSKSTFIGKRSIQCKDIENKWKEKTGWDAEGCLF